MSTERRFNPDWASPPGETIYEILNQKGITADEFAKQIDSSLDSARRLLKGEVEISQPLANRLESVLGPSTEFWLLRERNFRQQKLGANFLEDLPIRDMVTSGWIPPAKNRSELLASCLEYFGVTSIEHWTRKYRDVIEDTAFRTSPTFRSRTGSLASWLRKGELIADQMKTSAWNREKFRELLPKLRPLTRNTNPKQFIPELIELCADCGVGVVILKVPSGCRASGATRFLSDDKALLLLSFRYLSDDHFWFTFFHEAGHLLLHERKMVYVDDDIGDSLSADEEEANDFAAEMLIPTDLRGDLEHLGPDARAVMRFARRAGVSRGVVVGQMQHSGLLRRNQLNYLKTRFTW